MTSPRARDHYTVDQASRRLGMSSKTVWRWVTSGKLSGSKHGVDRRWWIPRTEVDELAALFSPTMLVGKRLIGRKEAQLRLGVSERTLRRWLNAGRLYGVKRGESRTDPWLIPEVEVERVRNGGMLRKAASYPRLQPPPPPQLLRPARPRTRRPALATPSA